MSITSSLDRLTSLPVSGHPPSSSSRRILRDNSSFTAAFDVLSQLGNSGPADGSAYSHGSHSSNIVGQYGHSGCVNALNWSSDGSLLASGSDDTRICLWKIGAELDEQENVHPAHGRTASERRQFVKQFPGLGMGLQTIIHTGHRANIFSVKFAQHSRSTIFSAAGDHEVRVFDIERASSIGAGLPSRDERKRREWTEYTKDGGVVTRVLKCHRGRVKRIALDSSSPSTFLTCSEDGTVRQHDLRTAHTCKSHCPPPLCSYKSQGIGLYSLTVSSSRPELFVVAGTSQYAFLHDRRMVPRLMQDFWRVKMRTENELTMCVRRFGPPVPPLIPNQNEDAGSGSDGEENGSEEEDNTYPGRMPESRRRRTTTRMRAAATRDSENHVTAAKLSNANGRDLLLTYSGGPVALYDIFADPEGQSGSSSSTFRHGSGIKRNRGLAEDGVGNPPQDNDTRARKLKSGRTLLSVSPPAVTVSAPEEKSVFVTASTEDDELADEEIVSETTEESPQRSFEIGVGDDGELEMAISADSPSSLNPGSETETASANPHGDGMNRDGLRALLSSTNAPAQEESDGQDGASMGAEESYGSEDESESASQDDDEDDISSSDDPTMETLQPLLDAPHTPRVSRDDTSQEIPLVRPYRIYSGHRNSDTVKDVNFGGLADNLVLSGSDDGNVFIWAKGGPPPPRKTEGSDDPAAERRTESEGALLGIWHGDSSVVNVLQWHPFLPYLAVSGIDNTVKLLGPTTSSEKKLSRLEQREQIVQKNREALSNAGERWSLPPANVLLRLLAQAGGDEEEGDEADDGQPRRTRRIPLQTLMQLANEGYAQGEGGEDGDCRIM